MPGSVKNKIRGGTVFLFLLVVLSAGFSIYYLAKNKQQSKNILKANYESLVYSHAMQKALDSIYQGKPAFVDSFESKLILQENNITEPGETDATVALRKSFNQIKNKDTALINYQNIQYYLQRILFVNMAAIKNKNEKAEAVAENGMTYLVLIASVIFIVGFTFVYNFPSVVTAPIQKLTEAIKEIGGKNYSHRININSRDEFGEMAKAFNEMAERLEYFESSNLNKIIFQKTRAEAVINSLKDASIGIDKNNVVLFANNQALQLLGLAVKDIVGVKVAEVTKRNDLFKFLIEEKGNAPFKIVVDDRENYFTKEMMDISQDDASSKVLVLKNITSFKELDVAKTNFIATVSHELKTPLASSDFSLKLLEDKRVGELTEEQKELVAQLKNDNQRMLRILSELLNMSQVESGKIQLDIQNVSPYKIVESSVAAISGMAKEKQIKIDQKIADNLPDIKVDPDRINWVLNNFLTNAIRYSPAESTVIINVEKTKDEISFAVTDKGQGIDQTYISRIFERYFQIPGRSDKKGSGIGLAICKEFIDAMNGKIWVKSEIGIGSTFGFTFGVNGK